MSLTYLSPSGGLSILSKLEKMFPGQRNQRRDKEEEDVLATSRAFAVQDQIPAHPPAALCFLLRCLLLSLPVPVPATAIAVFPANRPSLSQLGPLPQRTPAPAFEPCSVPLLLSPWGSLRATAKALLSAPIIMGGGGWKSHHPPHSIIPHTEIPVAPVSCGPKLLQHGLR